MPSLGNRADSASEHGHPAERVFLDADGCRWRVFEQEFSNYDRRSGLSLIFASDVAVRRVREYPADWMELSVQELIALSWKS